MKAAGAADLKAAGAADLKKTALAVVAAAALLIAGAARPAQARLVDLHASGTAGGLTGWGTTPRTPDFFDSTRGPGVGFDLGVKVLFLDLSATFLQVLNGSGTAGTLVQLLLGGEMDIPLGPARLPGGQPLHVLEPKLAVGFGFGTPAPVHLPYTDAQVSAKGVLADGILSYEFFLNPFLAIGAQGTFGVHYFFGGDVVNDSQSHSSGYHVLGLGTVTFHLGL